MVHLINDKKTHTVKRFLYYYDSFPTQDCIKSLGYRHTVYEVLNWFSGMLDIVVDEMPDAL